MSCTTHSSSWLAISQASIDSIQNMLSIYNVSPRCLFSHINFGQASVAHNAQGMVAFYILVCWKLIIFSLKSYLLTAYYIGYSSNLQVKRPFYKLVIGAVSWFNPNVYISMWYFLPKSAKRLHLKINSFALWPFTTII